MSVAEFREIGVVGAGQMGNGIAQVCAMTGMKVILTDIQAAALENARNQIERSLTKLHSKDKINATQLEAAKANLTYNTDLNKLKSNDLVIEAIIEKESIKMKLFQQLDEILPESAIFASNTSSISVTRLGARTKRPQRFIGMHFMNPVPLMKLVEVIPGMTTDEQVTRKIVDLATAMGKTTVVSQDFPGFIVNRVLMPMINEAFRALQEGIATAEDIDAGMKLGCNQPMGPLTLADFIGLDTCQAIMEVLHEGLGDSRYAPCPLLKKYVEAGYFGVKTGQGVYKY